ncbi:MAG: helix-turn-helix transcriptional regulator [Cytophagales bacterium]|nr:helix-turn-helix transcriptional regulator [Cytophagales bacterium]
MDNKLEGINLRFIQAVDHVIDVHKVAGMEPKSARSLSEFIGKDPNTISRIRQGSKDVSAEQVKRLAALCGIDLNFFYNENIQLIYQADMFNEENLKRSIEGQTINMDFSNSGNDNTNLQLGAGDFSGNIYNNGASSAEHSHRDTHYHFHKAEQLVKTIPAQFQQSLTNQLQEIKLSYMKLERELLDRTEELKKITKEYLAEIKLSQANQTDLMEQLKKEREAKDDLYLRYIKSLENK